MPQHKITDTQRPRPATAHDVVAAAQVGNLIFQFHIDNNRFPNENELKFLSEHQRFPTSQELALLSAH